MTHLLTFLAGVIAALLVGVVADFLISRRRSRVKPAEAPPAQPNSFERKIARRAQFLNGPSPTSWPTPVEEEVRLAFGVQPLGRLRSAEPTLEELQREMRHMRIATAEKAARIADDAQLTAQDVMHGWAIEEDAVHLKVKGLAGVIHLSPRVQRALDESVEKEHARARSQAPADEEAKLLHACAERGLSRARETWAVQAATEATMASYHHRASPQLRAVDVMHEWALAEEEMKRVMRESGSEEEQRELYAQHSAGLHEIKPSRGCLDCVVAGRKGGE